MVSYVLRLDGAPSPNTTIAALTLQVVPDPIVRGFMPKSVPLSTLSNMATLLTIEVSTYVSGCIRASIIPSIASLMLEVLADPIVT